MQLAKQINGVLVNADSMQVYREIPILSGQPSVQDRSEVPHLLYGHVSAAENYSTGRWLKEAADSIRSCHADGKVPIVVGGTGLYFDVLVNGLADIPDIPTFVRSYVRQLYERFGLEAVGQRLQSLQAENTNAILQMDSQRAQRALEVRLATGRSIRSWHSKGRDKLFDDRQFLSFVIAPPREHVYRKCEQRFDQMITNGALEEVKDVRLMGLPSEAPAAKALGIPQLSEFLAEKCSFEAAVTHSKTATRRYAKRQFTWINSHMITWKTIFEQESETISSKIFSIIKENGLTMT